MGRRDLLRAGAGVTLAWLWAGCWEDNSGPQAEVEAGTVATALASGRPIAGDAGADSRVPIVWVETGICTGCAISLLNAVPPVTSALDASTPQEASSDAATDAAGDASTTDSEPAIAQFLEGVRIEFQETMMDRFGAGAMADIEEALTTFAGEYIMLVDGAIPTGATARMTIVGIDSSGKEWTAEEFVQHAAGGAKYIAALGTCASWGGIPSAAPNPGNHKSLAEVLGKSVLRIPGCPPHPDWIALSLTALLNGTPPDLDSLGRPLRFFANTIHSKCPRLGQHDNKVFATQPGDTSKCLRQVGCKGPVTRADCVERQYLGRNHCIKANHPCIGCAAPGFPDAHPNGSETLAMGPLYSALPKDV